MQIHNTRYTIHNTKHRGATLIEALVLLFVFGVMTVSFYTAYSLGLSRIIESRNKLQAVSLASEQMERIRNLPYDEVRAGTSIPGCDPDTDICYIDADYTTELNNVEFRVVTDVLYQDDAEDGTLSAGTDTVPTDYKRVVVTASWAGGGFGKEASLFSRFVPPGLESGIPGTGALSINVLDYAGQSVSDIEVRMVNSDVSPAVDLSAVTDSDGNILLYGVPEDAEYVFTLKHNTSPNLYEVVQTYPSPYGTPPYTPFDAHVPVVADALNTATFILNAVSSAEIHTVDPYGNAVTDVDFDLVGGRRLDIGADPPVYNHNASYVTDGEGEVNVPDSGVGISGGTYTVAVNEPGYMFWRTDISTEERETFQLEYGATGSVKNIVLVDESVNGLFIAVADNDTGSPIDGATVEVTDGALNTLDPQITDIYGMVYFPEDQADAMSAGTYTVDVSADGYQDDSQNSSITSGVEQVSFTLISN